tara:strand:- start:645 stop:851 length:207 start_codon:yes stop_codon:yes gene_type:complete
MKNKGGVHPENPPQFLRIYNLGVSDTNTHTDKRPGCSKCSRKAVIVKNKIYFCADCELERLRIKNGKR